MYGPFFGKWPEISIVSNGAKPRHRRWLAFQIQNHLMCKDWYDVYEDEILIARAVVPFDYGMVLSDSSQVCQVLSSTRMLLPKKVFYAFIGVNIGTDLSDMPNPTRWFLAGEGPSRSDMAVQCYCYQPGSVMFFAHVPDYQHHRYCGRLGGLLHRSWDPNMVPLLKFLRTSGSPPLLNVYPYYDYMQSNDVIPLDYALFRPLPPNKEALDSNLFSTTTMSFIFVVDHRLYFYDGLLELHQYSHCST
ncbi:hypothetical protein IFM89_037501 [Coptis chinensis]|uniref:Uncharacterized protein n=1 Tax=Coptis chinensis TaxID=261450 RepID=A0A835GZY9_9MAGN|nr:hypothetical protein IFM89_037501 [Coptis chinensis]